jgi:hypothetical protein
MTRSTADPLGVVFRGGLPTMNRAVGNWMQQKKLPSTKRGSSESLLPFSLSRSCRDHDTLNSGPGKSHRSFLVSVFPIVFMV